MTRVQEHAVGCREAGYDGDFMKHLSFLLVIVVDDLWLQRKPAPAGSTTAGGCTGCSNDRASASADAAAPVSTGGPKPMRPRYPTVLAGSTARPSKMGNSTHAVKSRRAAMQADRSRRSGAMKSSARVLDQLETLHLLAQESKGSPHRGQRRRHRTARLARIQTELPDMRGVHQGRRGAVA
jgi:hypothetical protein